MIEINCYNNFNDIIWIINILILTLYRKLNVIVNYFTIKECLK